MVTSLMRAPRGRRGRFHIPRVLVVLSITMVAWAPPTHAQLLNQLLQPVVQTVGGLLGPLDPILEPILDPLLGLLTSPTVPNEQKLDAALKVWSRTPTNAPTPQRVIVTAAPGKLPLVKSLLTLVGGLLKVELPGINALVAEVSLDALGGLLADGNVVSVSIDAPLLSVDGNVTESLTPPTPPTSIDGDTDTNPSLRATLGLDDTSPKAAGVGVAVIDSGIAPSSDFSGRISAFFDFTGGNGAVATAPIDPYGHGTHVAGIIASSGATSSNGIYRGLGPSARLIGLRVLDANGGGQTSQVIQAIEFATNNRVLLGIHAINLSLGHPIYERASTDPLVRAVERAVDAGLVVVASAGNYGFNRSTGRSGYAGITSPGNAPSAITVGALRSASTITRDDDDVAAYSSRGPSWYDGLAKPDVLAPGHGIISNGDASSGLYATYPSVRAGASHMRLNGTSMAAAATTGVVALVIEAHRQAHLLNPALAPNTIKAILQYTATPLGPTAAGGAPDALVQGAGAINVPAALAVARGIDASRPVGADWLSGAYAPTSIYGSLAEPWSQTVTWGATQLSGDLLNLHRASWDKTYDWGASVQWAADVAPGPNLVWDHVIDWASNIVWGDELVGMASDTDDQTYVWGNVDSQSNTAWGNLATAPGGGQTYVWGNTDPPSQP
jgi:serine protease AprX